MSFFGRLIGKKSSEPKPIEWPNLPTWGALKDNETVQTVDGPIFLRKVHCGELFLPSGKVVACDPFVTLSPIDCPFVVTPAGRFPVFVTLADVSEKQDRSHIREAYASIVFSTEREKSRKVLPLAKDGQPRLEMRGEEFVGFCVDAGTACFVDATVVGPCMPDPKTWYHDLFENDQSDCWFKRMDDPQHIRAGIANIVLPLAKRGENLILFHSGWGDGVYPVIGSFDSAGNLLAVHIDFLVIK